MATINKVEKINLNESISKKYDIGYKNLDMLLGGLKEGTIITIGARPGMGKTTFVNNIVINLLEKYNLPTLYVSLEASKEITTIKLSALSSKKAYSSIRNNKELMDISMEEFLAKKYNLYISDDCYNILELEQLLEENKDIKFLIIDYIQLMRNEKSFTSVTDLYNDIIDRIRILATKHKIIIFLLSQLSRHVEYREDKRPLLVDLKNSGNLENNSDVVIMLYHDYSNKQGYLTINEIIVSKNRFGCVGMTCLEYDKNLLSYIEY